MRFPLVRDHFISIDYPTHMYAHVWNRHIWLVQMDAITYSDDVRRGQRVGRTDSTKYFSTAIEYRAASPPLPASIKHNSGIIIPSLFFLSSSVLLLYLCSHISSTLLSRQPLLFTFNFSLWILIARCVFPGSVLIRIMISAADSAATSSEPPEVFLSWALLLSAGGLYFADSAFSTQNTFCFPAN